MASKNTRSSRASRADIVKFIGLIAFFIVMALVVFAVWPYLSLLFEEGGIERLIDQMDNAGLGGVLLLEALQFLQIVVAFIPGEIVQFTAGMLYGPWWGALIILVGCILSSAFIFLLVHKLGAPFVHDMVPKKYLAKFEEFERSDKFSFVVFILFLIPGLPKDVFTYITPLSDMRFRQFILITNTARIPGIVLSTYAANGLIDGNIGSSIGIFLALAIIAGIALLVFSKITKKAHAHHEARLAAESEEATEAAAATVAAAATSTVAQTDAAEIANVTTIAQTDTAETTAAPAPVSTTVARPHTNAASTTSAGETAQHN